MEQRNSEGVCQKIYNAVCPFRSTIHRISRLPQSSVSVTSDQKPLSQPVKISSPQTKAVHVLHHSIMIPIEFDPSAAHFSAQENNASITFSAGKETSTLDREIQIVKSHGFGKSASKEWGAAQPEKVIPVLAPVQNKQPNHLCSGMAMPNMEDDDPRHETKFSNYIAKVKNRMMRAASHVGGADGASACEG